MGVGPKVPTHPTGNGPTLSANLAVDSTQGPAIASKAPPNRDVAGAITMNCSRQARVDAEGSERKFGDFEASPSPATPLARDEEHDRPDRCVQHEGQQ